MFVHRKNLSWWIQQEFVGHNRVLLFKRLPAKKTRDTLLPTPGVVPVHRQFPPIPPPSSTSVVIAKQ